MDWTQIIITLITLVVAPCMILLAKEGIALLKSKTKSETLITALTEMDDAVATAVTSTAQTYTDALKAAAADGKLTDGEKSAALSQSINTVKNSLSASVTTYYAEHNTDLEKYIKDKIEAYIGGILK